MAKLDEVKAELAGDGPAVFEKLADRLGVAARAATIFGEAVESGGVTVIPVAKARWGLGGGFGRGGRRSSQEGMGGGGGVIVEPTGFIEVKDGEARFRPISKTPQKILLALAGAALLGWALRRRG